MNDLLWGLQMMVVGMGVVFLLLLLLMAVLMLVARLEQPKPAAEAGPATEPDEGLATPAVTVRADGLDEDTLAAIAVAVITHAENRRKQAAPEVRAHEPGSQLFASRWVNVGRTFQNAPFRRR